MGLFSKRKTTPQYRAGGLGGLSQIQPTRTDASVAQSDFKQTAIIAALAFMLVGSLSYIAMQSIGSNNSSVTVAQPAASEVPVAPVAAVVPEKPKYPEIKAYAPVVEERAFVSANGSIDVLLPEREPYFVYPIKKVNANATPLCVTELRKPARAATFYFDVGSAELGTEHYEQLAALGKLVNDCPEALVHVTGHSDTSGNDLANLDLSWKRADSTVNALATLGLNTTQFEPVGFGARSPLAQGAASDEDRNRRVEFHVLFHDKDH